MFGLFKKNNAPRDLYLEKVADILFSTMGSVLPLQNAYSLAEECLTELRNNISKGMFHDGPNPRHALMAYYSLCSMVSDSGVTDNETVVLMCTIKAWELVDKFKDQSDLTTLEKGILQYGELALSEGANKCSKEDIELVKLGAVEKISELINEQGASVDRDDLIKIVENVSAGVGMRQICKIGDKVLVVSVLSNAVGYYIDQGDIQMAKTYFSCINPAMRKYFAGQMESFNDHQKSALRTIMEGCVSLGEELMDA